MDANLEKTKAESTNSSEKSIAGENNQDGIGKLLSGIEIMLGRFKIYNDKPELMIIQRSKTQIWLNIIVDCALLSVLLIWLQKTSSIPLSRFFHSDAIPTGLTVMVLIHLMVAIKSLINYQRITFNNQDGVIYRNNLKIMSLIDVKKVCLIIKGSQNIETYQLALQNKAGVNECLIESHNRKNIREIATKMGEALSREMLVCEIKES